MAWGNLHESGKCLWVSAALWLLQQSHIYFPILSDFIQTVLGQIKILLCPEDLDPTRVPHAVRVDIETTVERGLGNDHGRRAVENSLLKGYMLEEQKFLHILWPRKASSTFCKMQFRARILWPCLMLTATWRTTYHLLRSWMRDRSGGRRMRNSSRTS